MRPRQWLLAAVVLGLGVAAGRGLWPQHPLASKPDDSTTLSALPGPSVAAPVSFGLHDQHGRAFGAADLRGKVALVFFGYTFCPDVCPTTVFEMQQVKARLGAEADRYRGVFITVDPARDTQERLRAYLAHFDPALIGLRGPPEALAAAARSFGAVYERGQSLPDGGYLMGHTAFGHLLDADGRLHTVFPTGASADEMTAVVRTLLDGS